MPLAGCKMGGGFLPTPAGLLSVVPGIAWRRLTCTC